MKADRNDVIYIYDETNVLHSMPPQKHQVSREAKYSSTIMHVAA